MEKELELSQIVAAYNVLEGTNNMPFALKNLDVKFKGKTAFKLSMLKVALRDLATTAEEVRQTLIRDKYGVADENGNVSIQSEENFEGFMKEYGEVLSAKHTITFSAITMEEVEEVELPVAFTDVMMPFFVVE
jgi:DNA gyrase/topoisomerase IV subunit B